MYEYKVLTLKVKETEEVLNGYGKEGWRAIAISPNIAIGVGLTGFIATLERKRESAG